MTFGDATILPTSNHGSVLIENDCGTPYQLFFPDNQLDVYKRFGSSSWGTWQRLNAGYAETASRLATARTISLTGAVTGSGSFDGSGNLSIATSANHTHSYYPLTGGFLNGHLYVAQNGWPQVGLYNASQQHQALIFSNTSDGTLNTGLYLRCYTSLTADTYVQAFLYTDGSWRANSVYGAVWNDYAEYRQANTTEPGYVVAEVGDDTLAKTTERMKPACSIISDTFGFAIGETKECKTPLAQAGRVLAYPYEDRNSYKPGDAVCSAPDGKVSKMTQEEKINHPECIIGYVSCVPEYETWGEKDTKVNDRIWIKVV